MGIFNSKLKFILIFVGWLLVGMTGARAEGIMVKNAGIVLLNAYCPIYFNRLGLTDKTGFISKQAQQRAGKYLQYLVTGLPETEDAFLPLNKVLTGLPLDAEIDQAFDMSEEEIQFAHGLLMAAVGYWPEIGDPSISGFQGNWLQRDGLLEEKNDYWQLTVEKRAYDILLNHAPFAFSIIKFPWMLKPLHVIWQY